MRRKVCSFFGLWIFLIFTGASATSLNAQNYPSRPVKIVTDVGTGGTYDIFARAMAEELNKRWGQGVIIEPHPGGNAVIGNRACADSAPDGYTICMLSNQGLVANEALYKKLPYSRTSFTPIMNLFYNTQVIVVNASLNVKTLGELAALAKAKPGTLNYIVPGTFQRVFFERFNKQYGTDLVAVPFKGGGDALTGVLSGITPIAFIGGANFAPYVRDGKMVALAVDSLERSPLFPDTPRMSELGYPDNMPRTYLALMAPAGTPRDVVMKVHGDVAAIMKDPAFRKRHVIDRGLEPVVNTPEEFSRFLEDDRNKTQALAKEAGIEPQ
ncbi:MAG TPA: tripartite tricarboxylate transporter substrate binding protein [Xanthobacteraceae bacterium]|nr:tripartite tricarboxylate transporter substrate binding protein [Xanthobacteraceae bacterium]